MPLAAHGVGTLRRCTLELAIRASIRLSGRCVRIVEPDGRWVLVLPDPAQAITHLWAEAPTAHAAAALLDEWTAVVAASHPE